MNADRRKGRQDRRATGELPPGFPERRRNPQMSPERKENCEAMPGPADRTPKIPGSRTKVLWTEKQRADKGLQSSLQSDLPTWSPFRFPSPGRFMLLPDILVYPCPFSSKSWQDPAPIRRRTQKDPGPSLLSGLSALFLPADRESSILFRFFRRSSLSHDFRNPGDSEKGVYPPVWISKLLPGNNRFRILSRRSFNGRKGRGANPLLTVYLGS